MPSVRVFAPATIANVGPGFDMYGLAIDGIGDVVEARTTESFSGVKLVEIVNNPGLPMGRGNVAEAVGQKVLEMSGEELGIELILYKNMGIGTGLGSSGSSSVAAAVAVNQLLSHPMAREDQRLREAVVYGEAVATKSNRGHPDNVLPSLYGGFVFIHDQDTFDYLRFEGQDDFYFALVSPDLQVNTGEARKALLAEPYNMPALVRTSARYVKNSIQNVKPNEVVPTQLNGLVNYGGDANALQKISEYLNGAIQVIRGVSTGDARLFGRGVTGDSIVTPVRARFIPGYSEVQRAAFDAGALGFSISGSGPSMFAVADSGEAAKYIGKSMQDAVSEGGSHSALFISNINNSGAQILE